MKRFLFVFIPLAVIAGLLLSKPMMLPAQARTVRLFLIGNSFSQNAIQYLPGIAKQGGHELVIGRAEAPGFSLQQHWEAVEAAEANAADSKGKIYGGKSLRELLSAGSWDVVTIQQASVASTHIDSYRPYAQKLRDFVRQLQPQAEVVLHQTWAYRNDATSFGVIAPNQRAGSDREMWEKLLVAYQTVAAELGLRIIPVGNAFWRAGADAQRAYKKDANYDFVNPVFPNLPDQTNSLHEGYRWEGQTKLGLDANHANESGKYLGSLVWYGFLFGDSTERVTFTPPSVPAGFAAHLRHVAAQALYQPPLDASRSPVIPASATTAASTPAASTPAASTPVTKASTQSTPAAASAGRGLDVVADTSVRGGSYSGRAFPGHPILRVRNTSNLEHARKAYLKFNLAQLPHSVKNARAAQLNLSVGPAEGNSPAGQVWTFQVFGLKDAAAGEDWNEGSVSWDTAPANDPNTASTLTADAQLLGTFTLAGKGEEGQNVAFSSPELLRFLQSDTNGTATLIITRKESGESSTDNVLHIFAASEHTTLAGPNLSVSF